jgi:hypothetical protein
MEGYKNVKLYKKDGGAYFTEYPFFYDGITYDEFQKKKKYYIEHFQECRFERNKEFWDKAIEGLPSVFEFDEELVFYLHPDGYP